MSELTRIASSVYVSEMATERLEAEITTGAAHLAAAMCRWLLLVGEYDRRRAYEQWECLSMVQWLGVHAGISQVTARQHVAVARRLMELPLVREAFARGELSFSRVRAVCRIATPQDEDDWVELARHATASQLERIVTDRVRVARANEPDHDARQQASRSLTWWFDDDGMCHLTGVLPPDVGTLLANLITGMPRDSDGFPSDGEGRQADNADAFARLIRQLATGDRDAAASGALIVVHRYPDGTAKLEGGPPISGEMADRLAVGATTITATHTTDEISYAPPPKNGTRRTRRRRRVPGIAMRRFLQLRDGQCRFHGCNQRGRLRPHHVHEYSNGGDTVAENLVLLCDRHHGAIHRRGWRITALGNGAFRFDPPVGTTWPAPDGPGDPHHPFHQNTILGITPDSHTITPRSGGQRYDHHLTIWALANRNPERHAPRQAA